jgi:hypothetical protein
MATYSYLPGLEIREYGRRDPSRWSRGTLYPQTLALTSPTSDVRSVGIVRSRTQATEFNFFIHICTGTDIALNEWSAELEVPTAVVMWWWLWDIKPCSPVKVNRRFILKCHLHLQGGTVGDARNQHEACCNQMSACYLLYSVSYCNHWSWCGCKPALHCRVSTLEPPNFGNVLKIGKWFLVR